jgi:membrane protein implicated in regulation of membrane protease activity
MEPTTILIIIGVLAVIAGLSWWLGRTFLRLLKHVVIAVILGVVLMLVWYYQSRPPHDPNIGKHAYVTATGRYVGKVIGSARDDVLGEVWIIEPPTGYAAKYRKSRLTLKDQ